MSEKVKAPVALRADVVTQAFEAVKEELELAGKEIKMTLAEAEMFEKAIEKTIINNLEDGFKVQLIGFCSLEAVKRNSRNGRNVRTEETIFIPATMSPKFKAGKELKDAIKALPVFPISEDDTEATN